MAAIRWGQYWGKWGISTSLTDWKYNTANIHHIMAAMRWDEYRRKWGISTFLTGWKYNTANIHHITTAKSSGKYKGKWAIITAAFFLFYLLHEFTERISFGRKFYTKTKLGHDKSFFLSRSIFASQGFDPLPLADLGRFLNTRLFATDIVHIKYGCGVTGDVPIRLYMSKGYRLGIWRSIDHINYTVPWYLMRTM